MKGKWVLILALCLLAGCGSKKTPSNDEIDNPESPAPQIEEIRLPESPGILTESDDLVLVDYSCTDQGYIRAKTLRTDHLRLKIRINFGEEVYTYDLNKDLEFETFPLTQGDGTYTVIVYENIEGTRYTPLFQFDMEVTLADPNLPYLYPNQIVDYDAETTAVKKSFELVAEEKTELDRVKTIYDYVTETIDYDWDKVEAAEASFILPIVDETLTTQKGICFDYAALMATMLRVQNIPTKVVTGYVEEGYHAWVEVYIHNMGWIAPHIYFELDTWTRIDPTFDALDNAYRGKYTTRYVY